MCNVDGRFDFQQLVPLCGINFAVRHLFVLSGQNNDTSENDMSLLYSQVLLAYARLSLLLFYSGLPCD